LAQNISTGRILTDVTNNTSVRSSFLRSPIPPNVSGPVLGTPDYLSKSQKKRNFHFDLINFVLGPEILMQDENHSK
jgi:hypothetical protein